MTNANALQIVFSRPGRLRQLAQPRLNKQSHISAYLAQLEARDYDVIWAEIIETVHLDCAAWNKLMDGGLLDDYEWLAEKGGYDSWAFPGEDFFKLTEAQQQEYRRTAYSFYIAVVAPTGSIVYIDPEGYRYARYVAFDLAGLRPEKSREDLQRDREATELASKPPAPAKAIAFDRNATIKEIRAALKRRSGRAWSVTGGRGTAWGWIGIDVLPADHKLAHEEQEKLYAQLHELLGGTNCLSVPSGSDYYQEYIDRANGRVPSVHGTQYWD